MTDVYSREQRSAIMAKVKAKDTKPELKVRQVLHRMGFRFRLHSPKLPGKPDIILPRFRSAVFVNGCFWHGHDGCERAALPTTNTEYWRDKVARNKERDARAINGLLRLGWDVLVVWECEMSNQEELAHRLRAFIQNGQRGGVIS